MNPETLQSQNHLLLWWEDLKTGQIYRAPIDPDYKRSLYRGVLTHERFYPSRVRSGREILGE